MSAELALMPDTPIRVPAFDYSGLDKGLAERTQARAERIAGFGRQTVEIMGKVGRELIDAQAELEHGLFLQWVDAIGLSKSTAYRAMDVARNLGEKLPTLGTLPLTIVQAIGASSTPEPIRQEIVAQIEAGERVEPDAIKDRIRKAKDEAKAKVETDRKAAAWAKLTPEEQAAQSTKAKRKAAAEERDRRSRENSAGAFMAAAEARKRAATEVADLIVSNLPGSVTDRVASLIEAAGFDLRSALVERLAAGRA